MFRSPRPLLLPPAVSGRSAMLLAITMMLISGLIVTVMDVIAKWMSDGLDVGMVVWGRYIFHLTGMLVLIPFLGWRALFRVRRPVANLVRGALLLACAYAFFTGLKHVPLADATALVFGSPLIVVALSIPLLGERVGPRRWIAVIAGLAGILLIVRPGFAEIHWAYLLVLLVAVMYSLYTIMTRALGQSESPVALLFYTALVGGVLSSFAVPLFWQTPTPGQWGLLVLLGLLGGSAHLVVIHAYRLGEVSLLAPFQYAQIVWATILGFLVFGDLPDRWTLAGAGIVVASGIYIWHRERKLAAAPVTRTAS